MHSPVTCKILDLIFLLPIQVLRANRHFAERRESGFPPLGILTALVDMNKVTKIVKKRSNDKNCLG